MMRCEKVELVSAYALHALAARERAAFEAHLADCPDCRRELEILPPVIDGFAPWPTDLLHPKRALRARLAGRIAE